MKRTLSLIVNYKNSLGLWHTATEQMIRDLQNGFISIEYFAEFVAEKYLFCGCSEVVCIEFLKPNIKKADLNNLAKLDMFTDNIEKFLGRRWTFHNDTGDQSGSGSEVKAD